MSYIHDPNAVGLIYGQDWTDWLATAETISSATATCTAATWRRGTPLAGTQESPALITIASVSAASPLVTFKASGGTPGVDYDITVHVTSSTGEQDDRTTRLKCANR